MKVHTRRGLSVLMVAAVSLAGIVGVHAQAQLPSSAKIQPSDRAKVLELLTKGDTPGADKMLTELQAQLHAGPALPGIANAVDAGSIFFEELKSCGFYPQETRLECVIEIKRTSGYNGGAAAVGSMEHVYFCVDWNNNGVFTQLESAGQGSVQMHDGSGNPPWSYAVYRDFNLFGGTRTGPGGVGVLTTTTAPTVKVQATLSWNFAPTGCNYLPVWGNTLVFQIRLDPIR